MIPAARKFVFMLTPTLEFVFTRSFPRSPPLHDGPLTISKLPCVSQEVQRVLTSESVAESHPSLAAVSLRRCDEDFSF